MKKPEFITFTGIDDRTDLTKADDLARKYDIEWGVLFSANNRDARFPSLQTLDEIKFIYGSKAAHVCGQLSREIQDGNFSNMPFERNDFYRIQVNGHNVNMDNMGAFSALTNARIITQIRVDSFSNNNRHHELFDQSGGKGILPTNIPRTRPDKLVGFAGGMGPDTVINYINMIEGDGPFWIDMEAGVRTNGWFDLDKVAAVCQLVYDY